MLRFIPMFITGVLLNIIVVLTIHRVSVVWLLGNYSFKLRVNRLLTPSSGIGTFVTGCAPIFFAVIIPSSPYWAFGFPSSICAVFGADFVFAAGTLYVAKIVKEDEQSLAGGMFQTMTQVTLFVHFAGSFADVATRCSDRDRTRSDRDYYYIQSRPLTGFS